MSLFARVSWPGDHRDEIVAGTLVAAVIVVLGYASGIGVPTPTTIDTAAPPAVGTPSEPSGPADGSGGGDSGVAVSDPGAGAVGDSWTGGGDAGIPVVVDTPSAAGHDGHGTGGEGTGHGTGHDPTPAPSASATDSPSPTPSDGCDEGEVRLVQPLLSGALTQVTGLLDGLTGLAASPSPSTSSSSSSSSASDDLCVGVAASPSILAGVLP